MKGRAVRVALGQIAVEPGRPDANIARALAAIEHAAAAGADALVLPECLDFGWIGADARSGAEPLDGPRATALAAGAAAAGIVVAAGLSERAGTSLHNAAILIDRDGRIVGTHAKINELDIASDLYVPGRKLEVFDTAIGRIGLAICADLLVPETGAALARMGAELILSPSAWAVPAGHDEDAEPYGGEWRSAYGRIAADGGVPVAAASNVGRVEGGLWHGRPVIGRSLAMDGDGQVAALGAYGREDLPIANLHPAG